MTPTETAKPAEAGEAATTAVANELAIQVKASAEDPTAPQAATGGAKAAGAGAGGGEEEEEKEDGPDDLFEVPDSIGGKIWFGLSLPYVCLFSLTIPRVDTERFENWYWPAFVMCILWIGFMCFVMVEAATALACIMNVHPVVMGILVLSVGTSVPDAIGSMIASRNGEADMAIANAIGSNVFDILLGLGFPWMLYVLIEGKPVAMNKPQNDYESLEVVLCILLFTVGIFVSMLKFNDWTMNKTLGYMLLFVYLVYVIYVIVVAAVADKGCPI
jgi:Ca2+/Na+ antiporter